MSAVLPKSAPFAPGEIELLNRVVAKTTPQQRSWLAGFLAGFEAGQAGAEAPVAAVKPKLPLTILFASEGGNCEGLAFEAQKIASKHRFDAKVVDMADADVATLREAQALLIFAATWGEGDPPSRAAAFYALLMGPSAPRLDGVPFAVLGLGDTAYAQFCAVGRALDARLEVLGGRRVAERADLDLDFAKAAAVWSETTLAKLAPDENSAKGTVVHVDFTGGAVSDATADAPYTQQSPAEAEIGTLINLNGSGSTRETWHVELHCNAPEFSYLPGDAIGIIPENDPQLVEALLKATGLSPDPVLGRKIQTETDITTLSRRAVDSYAQLTGRDDVKSLLEGDNFSRFAPGRQLVDLFEAFPEKLTEAQLLSLLRPLPGRLYSVASSPKARPGEAHLLIEAVRWEAHGHRRAGVASSFIADRRKVGDQLRIYIKPNRHFRLPADGHVPIIMIGAGTGIAPYRGFMQERIEMRAKGKTWLIFGERNFTNDFLYQLEWQEHLASGALSRIDLAFSRDQPQKIYVQQRLWEHRAELRRWIEDGAHVYLCGDEKGMARDVETTLARILAEPLSGDETAGVAQVKELAQAERYQRDVY